MSEQGAPKPEKAAKKGGGDAAKAEGGKKAAAPEGGKDAKKEKGGGRKTPDQRPEKRRATRITSRASRSAISRSCVPS